MKANELFIGAIFSYELSGNKHLHIIDAHSIEAVESCDGLPYKTKGFIPIPLTPAVVGCIEGVMEYNGWVNLKPNKTWDKVLCMFYSITHNKVVLSLNDEDDQDIVLPHITALHDLQRLFMSLTGQEMKVDIEKIKTVI